VSIAGGDAPLDEITEAAFDRIATINLRGAIMSCKHVLPLMASSSQSHRSRPGNGTRT
jgi:NAD(P)-dependent dehydrogenase (short-subunit alcohol dehydrogenase family)